MLAWASPVPTMLICSGWLIVAIAAGAVFALVANAPRTPTPTTRERRRASLILLIALILLSPVLVMLGMSLLLAITSTR